jgi:peptidoglycan/LPS O-acetylase OafA/YrhL
MVLFVHVRASSFVEFGALPAGQKTYVAATFFAVTRLGEEAVLVFFVLSGFLVGGQIIDRLSRGTFDLRRYAVDRVTRIGLPLLPAVGFAAVVSLLLGDYPSVQQIIGNVFGLNGVLVSTIPHNDPLWSLAYEIWFYVLGGAIAYCFVARGSLFAVLSFACALAVFSALSALFLLFWMLGAMMSSVQPRRLGASIVPMALGLLAIGLTTNQLSFASQSFDNITIIPHKLSQTCISVGLAMLLPLLASVTCDRILAPLKPASSFLASVSYSVYLFHFPTNDA